MIETTIIRNVQTLEPVVISMNELFSHGAFPNGISVEVCVPIAGHYDRIWFNMHTADTFGATTIDHVNLPANWTW